MESSSVEDKRKTALHHWLAEECGITNYHLQLIVSDASFRRYYRVITDQPSSYVVMDANVQVEDCHAYIAVAHALRALGLKTPEILRAKIEDGFLLITDFGDKTFLRILNEDNADQLYSSAIDSLSVLQTCKALPGKHIPHFNRMWMMNEWSWFKGWFLQRLLALDITAPIMHQLDVCYARLVDVAATQPQCFMHRDYHSANLMWLPEQHVGILDFQDAFIGPITYDLVSLLRDCYIKWPEEKVIRWVKQYYALSEKTLRKQASEDELLYWFDLMGIQRHIKALMTFARKFIRDRDPRYLQHIPRTLHYIETVSARYPQLQALFHYWQTDVIPAYQRLNFP